MVPHRRYTATRGMVSCVGESMVPAGYPPPKRRRKAPEPVFVGPVSP